AAGQVVTATATDPGGNTSEFAKDIAATSATPSAAQIIDDSSATGFRTSGSWVGPYAGQGYRNEVRYAAAGAGASTAPWTFAVTPGTYRVSVTYSPRSNWATNAPYTISGGTATTVRVNQRLAPSDLADQGVGWKDLATRYTVADTTLMVTLSNQAN